MNKESIITIAAIVFVVVMIFCVTLDQIMQAKTYLTEIPTEKMVILRDYQKGLEYMHTNIDEWTWEEFKRWEKDRLHREARILYYANETLDKLKRMGQLKQ